MGLKRCCIFFCIFFLMAMTTLPASHGDIPLWPLQLSDMERDWVNSHPATTIHVGIEHDCGMAFKTPSNTYHGTIPMLLDRIGTETGLSFSYYQDHRLNLLDDLNNEEADLVFGNNMPFLGDEGYSVSHPLKTISYYVCSFNNYKSLLDIDGGRMGFLNGQEVYAQFREGYDVLVDPVFYESSDELYNGLIRREIDAVFVSDDVENNAYIYKHNISRNFKVRYTDTEVSLMGRADMRILVQIINRYLLAYEETFQMLVEEGHVAYLRNELVTSGVIPLQGNDPIMVGYIKDYAPFNYFYMDRMYGITVELMDLVGRVAERPIIYLPYTDRHQLLADFKEKRLTVIAAASALDQELMEESLVTKSYGVTNIAVVSSSNRQQGVNSLLDLEGLPIALVQDSWQEKLLTNNKVDFTPIYVNSFSQGMAFVNQDRAVCYLDSELVLSAQMQRGGFDRIITAGEMDILDSKHMLLHREDLALKEIIDGVIVNTNLSALMEQGVNSPLPRDGGRNFYEVMTFLMGILLVGISIFILILINRLNIEREKAQEASASKSEFLAKMSHELRTPLTAIMGYINLLSRSDKLGEREQEQLSIAANSSNILLHLVNDILDFSKIEAGKMQLVSHPFDLRTMVDNVANIIQISAEQKNLEFLVQIGDGVPRYVYGDQRRLEQVLINILSNSIKFTLEGTVKLLVTADYQELDVMINYVVSDTGIGIKSSHLEEIFSAFEQEDNSISRVYQGSGLGLYIARDFVEKMNGRISIDSTVGKGTKVFFYTVHKLANRPDTGTEFSTFTTEQLRGKKVLIAEDNEINQLIIKDMLISLGMKVIITTDGEEALEAASPVFDYIMLDIQMPVLDGISTLKQLKTNPMLARTPIIALTANILPEQIDQYFSEGFDGFCSKPIHMNEMISVLLSL